MFKKFELPPHKRTVEVKLVCDTGLIVDEDFFHFYTILFYTTLSKQLLLYSTLKQLIYLHDTHKGQQQRTRVNIGLHLSVCVTDPPHPFSFSSLFTVTHMHTDSNQVLVLFISDVTLPYSLKHLKNHIQTRAYCSSLLDVS